jgi:MFS family permease
MYILTRKMQKSGIIVIGVLIITIAMLMIGGSNFLDEMLTSFNGQPVFIFLGLTLIGLSAGMVSIPVLPEMLECIEEDEELSQKYDRESIENLISGMFVSFQSLGEAIGPIVSAWLAHKYNFRICQEVFGVYLTIYFLLYFLLCGNFSIFSAASP